MREPRDYGTELEALDQKARALRQLMIMQLGEPVTACKADQLPVDMLAGVLFTTTGMTDPATREAWRAVALGMFQKKVV